jgi:hypothetical protein
MNAWRPHHRDKVQTAAGRQDIPAGPDLTLRALLAAHGRSVCADPGRCRALLLRQNPRHGREVDLLVRALEHGVVAELVAAGAGPWECWSEPLVTRLIYWAGFTPAAARWAVTSWAVALGVITPAGARTTRARARAGESSASRRPAAAAGGSAGQDVVAGALVSAILGGFVGGALLWGTGVGVVIGAVVGMMFGWVFGAMYGCFYRRVSGPRVPRRATAGGRKVLGCPNDLVRRGQAVRPRPEAGEAIRPATDGFSE